MESTHFGATNVMVSYDIMELAQVDNRVKLS